MDIGGKFNRRVWRKEVIWVMYLCIYSICVNNFKLRLLYFNKQDMESVVLLNECGLWMVRFDPTEDRRWK